MSGSLKNIKVKEVPTSAPVPTAASNDQPVAPSIIYENTYKTKPDRK
jgi:glycerol dehydrogenase-like iron-containing ADH family enzyme